SSVRRSSALGLLNVPHAPPRVVGGKYRSVPERVSHPTVAPAALRPPPRARGDEESGFDDFSTPEHPLRWCRRAWSQSPMNTALPGGRSGSALDARSLSFCPPVPPPIIVLPHPRDFESPHRPGAA